jgi:hypothetical protein
MSNNLSYADRYIILAGRAAYADYIKRQQLIEQGQLVGLNIYPPNNDASIMPKLREGQRNTTSAQVAGYLSEVAIRNTTVPPTVPDAPLSLCVLPSDSELTIIFISGSNGGSAITNYKYSTDGVTYTAFSPAQTASPVTVSGLTNGTVYTIYLQAVNAIGPSEASSPVSAAPIPSSFSPASITGINVWLDGLNITTVITTSGQVSAWNDSSSEANDFAASGTGVITYAQPSNINSRPAVYFTTGAPTSTYLSKSFNISPSSNELTLLMIVNQTSTSTGNSELFFTYDDFRYFDLFSNTNPSQNGNLHIDVGSATQRDTGVDIITTPSTVAIIAVVLTTSTITVYVNGTVTSVSATARGATFPTIDTALNWAVSGGAFIGYVGEVITYPSALSATDREKVEGYLAWKWGLQSQLPSSNPWQTAPPTGDTAPGAPTLTFILGGNTNAYVYYTAGTGAATNYQYTTNAGTTYANSSPASALNPAAVPGLTNGVSSTLQLRAYNAGGYSSISNSLAITPSNPSVPGEWLLFDPNNSSCYPGTGTTVSNLGSYGALNGTIVGSMPYITGTGLTTKVLNFTGSTYINFGQVNFGSNFTISAWIYPSDNYSINTILANGPANVNTAGFKFGWNSWSTRDLNLLFESGDGTAGNWQVPNTVSNTVVNGVWQMVTVIFYRSTNISVFLRNGVPVAMSSITTATNVSVNQTNFNIGAYIGGSYRMEAQLGLLKVFNSSLTAGQVLADFDATRATFGI